MKYIAHRGLSSLAPENSITAFELAAQNPAYYGIECDVRQTKDLQFVVFHDDDLKRMVKQLVNVSELTYEELQLVVLKKGSKITTYKEEHIPLLTSYLDICQTYQKVAIIEIKSLASAEMLVDLVNLVDTYQDVKVVFISFNINYLKFLRAITDRELQLLVEKVNDTLIYDCRVNQIDFSISKDYLKPSLINKLKKKGFQVATYTVNYKAQMKYFEKLGVDYLTTDKKI